MSTDESAKITCPSCHRHYTWKQSLAGRTVKCKCGAPLPIPLDDPATADNADYDLLAPADEAPAYHRPAAAAPPAPLPRGDAPKLIPSPRGGVKYDDGAARRHEMKKMAAIGAALALLIGLVVGGRAAFRALSGPDTRNLPGHDGRVARLIKDDGGYEVLTWLKESPRRGVIGFFWTREQTEARAKDWYAHGAKNVLAFGGGMTASLAIELPAGGVERAYLFDAAEQIRRERMPWLPAQTDVKQKYVVIDFM